LTSLRTGASLVNLALHDIIVSEHSMSDFKELSRSVKGLSVLWCIVEETLHRVRDTNCATLDGGHASGRVDIAISGSSFSGKRSGITARPDQEKRHDCLDPAASPAFFR
jgi:hypothetical protein